MEFPLWNLVLSCYLILLWYSFLKFFFFLFHMFNGVCFHIFPSISRFPFLRAVWFCLDLVFLFLPSHAVFHFSFLSWHIFLKQIQSLYLDCKFPLPFLGFPIFSFLANSLMSSKYIRWLIFLAIYPPVHFLNMWLRDIAFTNSNGEFASTWKIPL